MQIFIQTIGWIGTFLIVLAYFLVSNKKIDAQSKYYELMNLAGAIGVGVNAFYQNAWPSFGLQIIWSIVAIIVLLRILYEGNRKIGVLFICQGNMMRSQIAEALYKKYKIKNAFSAGIFPIIEKHDGKKLREIDLKEFLDAMKNIEGIDLSNNICKEVTEGMVKRAGKVVVMANKEIWPGFLNDRKDIIYWEVENPNFLNYDKYKEIIGVIKKKIMGL